MASPYSGMQKSIDGVASAVKTLSQTSSKTEKRRAFDVDILTAEEVEELRLLIAHENDLRAFSLERIEAGGEKVRGMYVEFDRLGLVAIEIGGSCVILSPMAHWAVEKFDQRTRDARRDRKEQWAHDAKIAVISSLMGILGTILGVLLGWLVGSL